MNGWERTIEQQREEIARLRAATSWMPISLAPTDGTAFIAYGRHNKDCPIQDGNDRYKQGDHWWALLVYDIWRQPHQFVFCKDGTPGNSWGEPSHWLPLPEPPRANGSLAEKDG
jgi:hypothetical protein